MRASLLLPPLLSASCAATTVTADALQAVADIASVMSAAALLAGGTSGCGGVALVDDVAAGPAGDPLADQLHEPYVAGATVRIRARRAGGEAMAGWTIDSSDDAVLRPVW